MAGHKPYETLRAKMSSEQIKSSDMKLKDLKADMVLTEVRKHSGLTQKELADILGISQPTLSSQEHQDDMAVSTLSRMVSAMGGHLELVIHMPNGDIRLTQFAERTAEMPTATR